MFGKDITEKNVGKDILSILIRLHTQHVQDWRGVRIWYSTPFFLFYKCFLYFCSGIILQIITIYFFYKEILCKIVPPKFYKQIPI